MSLWRTPTATCRTRDDCKCKPADYSDNGDGKDDDGEDARQKLCRRRSTAVKVRLTAVSPLLVAYPLGPGGTETALMTRYIEPDCPCQSYSLSQRHRRQAGTTQAEAGQGDQPRPGMSYPCLPISLTPSVRLACRGFNALRWRQIITGKSPRVASPRPSRPSSKQAPTLCPFQQTGNATKSLTRKAAHIGRYTRILQCRRRGPSTAAHRWQ